MLSKNALARLYVGQHICYLTYMPSDIVDREEVIGSLLGRLTQQGRGANYALIGPRRIGKTAILEELEKRLTRSNVIVARIDFSKYAYDPSEFSLALVDFLTEAYERTLGRTSRLLAHVKHAVTEIKKLRRARIEFDITMGDDGQPVLTAKPTLGKEEPKHAQSFENCFSYASQLASVSGERIVVILDEAQRIVEWAKLNGMEAVMDQFRSIIDRLEEVSIVLSGSRVHMLRRIFGAAGSPLFGRFTLIEVGPLEERDAITLYLRRASQANRDEAKEVYKLVGGHPFYLLVMAEARRQNESVAQRYRRLLTSVTGGLYLYVNYILSEDLGSRVTETHYAKILRTLAQGEKKFSEIAKGLGTKAEWLTRYVTKLAEFDLVEKTNGTYKLKDRIVRDYFAFNYQEDAASPASDAKAT